MKEHLEQLDTEDWKAFRDDLRQKKYNTRQINVEIIERACKALSVEAHWLTLYHVRLSKVGCLTVDVFPTSAKTHFIGFRNPMRQQKNLGKFLMEHFAEKITPETLEK